MDLHPTDVGYETMAFQMTSPTLNMTLKLCVGRPFDENGMNRYNVYELNKKGDQVERLRGYYLLEKDVDPYDTDKDFNIKEIGEPTWITPEGVPKESKVEPKEMKVTKSEFIVMEDTNSRGDCFYDALLRAKSGNPTVKSTNEAIQAERLVQLTAADMKQVVVEVAPVAQVWWVSIQEQPQHRLVEMADQDYILILVEPIQFMHAVVLVLQTLMKPA